MKRGCNANPVRSELRLFSREAITRFEGFSVIEILRQLREPRVVYAAASYYFLPAANTPRLPGCTVMTSGPLVLPAIIGLFGMVS